jgi:hypothetical protein
VPRPSSPVHAKASTNCPYLTLESPRHQRQRWIGLTTDTKLGRAASRGSIGMDDNLSLVVERTIGAVKLDRDTQFRHQSQPLGRNQCRHGIDLKNPFTMSNNRGTRPHTAGRTNGSQYFIIWIFG